MVWLQFLRRLPPALKPPQLRSAETARLAGLWAHLHGLGRNPPQASVEAKMPQLLSGPTLTLSLVKVQSISCPADYFQQLQ